MHRPLFSNAPGITTFSQEHLKTQKECIMENSKIVNTWKFLSIEITLSFRVNIILRLFYFPKQGGRVKMRIAYKSIVQKRTKELRQCCMGGEIGSSLVNMIKGL